MYLLWPVLFYFLGMMTVSDGASQLTSYQLRCPVPKLENGLTRVKGKMGRNVRFNCKKDFQLMGEKYAHCVRGSWDVPIPVCIQPGCQWTRRLYMNGLFLESYRGAFVKVVCNPGYSTLGPNTAYCNGQRWNGSFPYCQPQTKEPAESCDFDVGGWCGWSHDPENKGTEWKISDARSEKPGFDHTSLLSPLQPPTVPGRYVSFGSSAAGVKISYVEQAARLYSPVYPADSYVNKDICFSLWYYLSGSSAGVLKVFILMEGDTVSSSIPEVWEQGDHGPKWKMALFSISVSDRDFQVVIEGSSGVVLIDDVQISSGKNCTVENIAESTTSEWTTVTDPFDTAEDFTCKGRCKQDAVLISKDITSDDLDEAPKCDCHPGCVSSGTCCQDYFQYCTSTQTTIIDSTSMAAETRPTTFIATQNLAKISTVLLSSSTRKSSITPTPSTTTTQMARVTNATTSMPKISTTHQAVKENITKRMENKRTSTVTAITRAKSTTTIPPIVRGKADSIQSGSTKKPLINYSRQTEKTSVLTKRPTSEVSNEIPALPPSNLRPNTVHPARKLPSHPQFSGDIVMGAVRSKETEVAHVKIPLHTVAEAAAGVAVTLLLTALIFIFVRRRRRRLRDSNLVEDSDVRFLTSDEDLDFTLATPSDSDL